MRNFGKGPAAIDRVLLAVEPTTIDELPARSDFSRCKEMANFTQRAVGAGEKFGFSSDAFMGIALVKFAKKIRATEDRIFAYGCVIYHDVFDNFYETGFCWEYEPLEGPYLEVINTLVGPLPTTIARGIFKANPKSHNYHRERDECQA